VLGLALGLLVSGCRGIPPIVREAAVADPVSRLRLQLSAPLTSTASLEILHQIARRLQREKRYSEAREAYRDMLALPLDLEVSARRGYESNLRRGAQSGLAECYEAEGRWGEALEAYVVLHLKHPVYSECGNGIHDAYEQEVQSIARCVRALDRP